MKMSRYAVDDSRGALQRLPHEILVLIFDRLPPDPALFCQLSSTCSAFYNASRESSRRVLRELFMLKYDSMVCSCTRLKIGASNRELTGFYGRARKYDDTQVSVD